MLLIASLLCWAFAIIADATRHLPEPLASYEKQQTNTGDDPVSIAGMISFVGVLVSYVGLFLVRKWGRTLFISSMAILVLLGLFERPIVETAAVDVLNSILMILVGAIVAVSFSTSIFDATDVLGLKDFLADWKRLAGRVLTRWKGTLQLFRNSKLGFISLTSALIVWIVGFTLLFANGVTMDHTGDKLPDALNLIWGFYFLIGIVISFIGAVVGVISSFKENSIFLAVIGACLSGFTFVIFGLVCLGAVS